MKLSTLSSCSLLLATCLGASAASLPLNPVADTYTRSGHSAGSATTLDVRGFGGGDFMAYLRFDLASSLPVGATIDSATLTLYYEPGSRQDTITAGRFSNFGLLNVTGNTPQNWDEATLAEDNEGQEYGVGSYAHLLDGVTNGWLYNLDADTGANVTETIGGSAAGDAETLSGPDLVAFLNNRVADNGLVTFISAINSSNRGYGFASKENSDSSVWPTLSLTYTVVPEPSSLALLGLGLFGLLARRFRKS